MFGEILGNTTFFCLFYILKEHIFDYSDFFKILNFPPYRLKFHLIECEKKNLVCNFFVFVSFIFFAFVLHSFCFVSHLSVIVALGQWCLCFPD